MDINENNISILINKAIENKELKAYYQPKYDALTSKLCGAEALSRWIVDDGSVLAPNCFIPLLEKEGLITKLDWYILNEACMLQRKLLDDNIKAVPISVNFSRMHTFEQDNFMDTLCGVVDKYNIPHDLIEIEITESALENTEINIINFIADIRKSGFNVSIDDFGSGLSSLSFVKDVPASILKIDKSLLSSNCEDEKERVVLESIFNFAHRLNLITVAEGVETEAQLGFLRTCGCKVIQGYLFAKPMIDSEYIKVCENSEWQKPLEEDILLIQPPATAQELLMKAVFTAYPLIIFSNLSRNSYYMMVYSNFTTQSCPSTGAYDELIVHGAATMHPDDRELFTTTFDVENQKNRYKNGEQTISVVTRQLGDDGIYRAVETTNYFVKNPSADDILAITLSRPLE